MRRWGGFLPLLLLTLLWLGWRPLAAAEDPFADVTFEGGASLSEKLRRQTVEEILTEAQGEERKTAYYADAAFELRSLYRSRGFPFVEVEFREGPGVVFQITEGPRTRLEEVAFEGAESFDPDRLRAFFTPPRRGFFRLWRDPYYVESRIVEGAGAVASFYRATGFLDVEVAPPRVRFSDDRRQAWVTVPITENQPHFLRSVQFLGAEALPQEELDRLAADMVNQPFHPRLPYEIEGRLRDLYGRRGYPEADFEVNAGGTTGPEGLSIHLAVTVDPGPRVTVTGIEVMEAPEGPGLKTRKGFLRSRITVEPGTLYDSAEVQESVRRLYATGLFDKVRLDLTPIQESIQEGDDAAARPLRLEVQEAPNTEYFVEPGYGSFEQLRLLAGWKRKNLFGAGVTLDADSLLAQRASSLRLAFTSPRLFTQELRFGLQAEFEERDFPSFNRRETSVDVSLQREVNRHLGLTLGYELSRSRRRGEDPVGTEDSRPSVDIAAVRFGARFDNRDNVLVPRKGWQVEALLEYAAQPLGTELDFFRVQTRLAWLYPATERLVLGLSWRSGVIVPLEDGEAIPIQERFFNGGENSVRSFREDRLGPVDDEGNPVGGEVRNTFSVELRYRLWGNLHGALFYDAGNVLPEFEEALDFTDLRTGVGVGLRYMLPIGPLRLDGAWNPDPRQLTPDLQEENFVVHLSVGMAF